MHKPSPFAARLTMAIASLVGLFASAYLFYTYVTGAPIACGIVSGCDVVRSSSWATTMGVPRPLLGMLFYTALFGLLVARVATSWRPRLLYRLTMVAAVVGFIESGFLFLIQWLDLKAFCFWCLLSAAAATVIAGAAWFDHLEETRHVAVARELRAYFVALLVFLPIAFFGFVGLVQSKAQGTPEGESINPAPEENEDASATVSSLLLLPKTPVTGSLLSKVLVVEFADFQCPACGAFHPTLTRIRKEYAGKVRFAFRHFPITQIHDRARPAAIAAQCAQEQGKFWEFADAVYADQQKLGDGDLRATALGVGMDGGAYDTCIKDAAIAKVVDESFAQARSLGVQYTPTLIVNRTKVDQAISYEQLKRLIDESLAGTR